MIRNWLFMIVHVMFKKPIHYWCEHWKECFLSQLCIQSSDECSFLGLFQTKKLFLLKTHIFLNNAKMKRTDNHHIRWTVKRWFFFKLWKTLNKHCQIKWLIWLPKFFVARQKFLFLFKRSFELEVLRFKICSIFFRRV